MTLTASNGVGSNFQQSFSLTVNPAGSFVFILSDFLAAPSDRVLMDALEHRWDLVPVLIQEVGSGCGRREAALDAQLGIPGRLSDSGANGVGALRGYPPPGW